MNDYRSGDERAAALLYERYAQRLRALARRKIGDDLGCRIDPDDIVQSVFCSFFRRAGHGSYDIPAGDELWKLLAVIAANKVRRQGAFHRAAKRNIANTCGGTALEGQAADATNRAFELQVVIDELLNSRPPVERSIVERRMEGYQVAEIADHTNRSLRTVERVLQQFRNKLDALITEDDTHAEHRKGRRG